MVPFGAVWPWARQVLSASFWILSCKWGGVPGNLQGRLPCGKGWGKGAVTFRMLRPCSSECGWQSSRPWRHSWRWLPWGPAFSFASCCALRSLWIPCPEKPVNSSQSQHPYLENMGDALYLPHKVVRRIRDNIEAVRNDEVVITADRAESRKIRRLFKSFTLHWKPSWKGQLFHQNLHYWTDPRGSRKPQ